MMSVSTGHSAAYLTGQVGAGMESYYTGTAGAGEPPGRWWGRGAAALGLAGEVDAEVMHAVYGQFLDPRDARFADEDTRDESDRLGRAPKQFRSPEKVVEDRIREYTTEHASTPSAEQVQAWRIEAERDTPKAVGFYDLTFSPDKSVTVMHTAFVRAGHEARQAGDTETAERWEWAAAQVEDAVMTGAAAGLDYVERRGGYIRTGRHGGRSTTGRWEENHELIVARFLQHTSRDLDPQLHVHQAVLNKAQGADGVWRALDGKALHTVRPAAAAISERVMESRLSAVLGVEWEMREDGVGRRVAGVDPQLEDLFSGRRQAITAEAEKRIAAYEETMGRPANNLERTRIAQAATLATRRAKTHQGESVAEQHDRWNAEASTVLAGGLARQAAVFERAWADAGADPMRGTAPQVAAQQLSPEAVIAQARESCHGPDGKSAYTRHDMVRRTDLALPANLGDLTPQQVADLIEEMVEQGMAGDEVVQVSGHAVGQHQELRAGDGAAVTVDPSRVTYANRGHLAAELAVLRACGVRGRTALDEQAVTDWLEETGAGPALTAAQRHALVGVACSDAAVSVLIGPAGTGKSYTAAVLDTAWRDLTARTGQAPCRMGGRVIGLAPTQAAADVLAEDGVADTANVPAFLTAQARLAAGRPLDGDARLQLARADVVLVDEASMLDTAALTRLQSAVEDAGARLVLMGDPHQLGPVGAGGMMRAAIDRDAQTFTLADVRRFTADWERDASLRLRDGDPDAVTDYDAHGRIVDAGTERAAIAALARAAAADTLGGREVVVVTATNDQAAAVNAAVRAHLAAAGRVADAGVLLGRDGTAAGVGDVVQARRLDRALGLVNRETYTVTAVDADGALRVTSTRTGREHRMPAGYVQTDLTLGYASTAHGAQGRTVDIGHVLLDPRLDRAGAYVGLSRGREANHAWAVTDTGIPDQPTTTGRGLLARILGQDRTTADNLDGDTSAAVDIAAADDARRSSAATLLGLIEDQTRLACRERLDADLDALVADGVLSEENRARLGAESGTEHLSRLLRAHEQAGDDPADVLRSAITDHTRSLDDARAVSQVLAARITPDGALPTPSGNLDAELPDRISDAQATYLGELHQLLADRRADLADDLAQDPPAWATRTLGPLPENTAPPAAAPDQDDAHLASTGGTGAAADAAEQSAGATETTTPPEAEPGADPAAALATWKERAGWLAAQREASGWDDAEQVMGRCPGIHTPEQRAAWHTAYTAAGRPEHRRPEAEMTDGRLLVRVRAAERAQAAAPPVVYDAQRQHHLAADAARRDADLARAQDDTDTADRHTARAGEHAEAAARYDEAAEARGRWLAYHAETLAAGEAAAAELLTRGKTPGAEQDRTTAEDWLAREAQARAADDAHRDITEADLAHDDLAHDDLAHDDLARGAASHGPVAGMDGDRSVTTGSQLDEGSRPSRAEARQLGRPDAATEQEATPTEAAAPSEAAAGADEPAHGAGRVETEAPVEHEQIRGGNPTAQHELLVEAAPPAQREGVAEAASITQHDQDAAAEPATSHDQEAAAEPVATVGQKATTEPAAQADEATSAPSPSAQALEVEATVAAARARAAQAELDDLASQDQAAQAHDDAAADDEWHRTREDELAADRGDDAGTDMGTGADEDAAGYDGQVLEVGRD